MRVYGNLMNRIAETIRPAIPQVGMGATILYHSDRSAYTIIAVDGKQITIQRDKVTRIDKNGMSESQDYTYAPSPQGEIKTATLRKNGTYVIRGDALRGGTIVRVGVRDEYYDFGF
jgi:hypothetical protein